MKHIRILLPFFILAFIFGVPRVHAQGQPVDTLYVSQEPSSPLTWQFSFKHSGPSLIGVNQIILSIDTDVYPYVRFQNNGVVPETPAGSTLQNWGGNGFLILSPNADKAIYCNQIFGIQHNTKDSLFDFTLEPNPNALVPPNIYDSVITITWAANQATADSCATRSTISTGSFIVIPTVFQYFPVLDTVIASASTPGCDPVFNFRVFNRNSLRDGIDAVSFQILNPYTGTTRPAGMVTPSGWSIDSVTTSAAYYRSTSGGEIATNQNLGNFIFQMRANPGATSFSFVMQAFSGGALIDRDTIWNVAATPKPCSQDPSYDTLFVTKNTGDCSFNFNLENFHTGQNALTTSKISRLQLKITTNGLSWSHESLPPSTGFCWSYRLLDSATLLYSANTPACAEPGGTTLTFPASVNNPNQVPFTVQWSDSSNTSGALVGVTSGTSDDTCAVPPANPDLFTILAEGSCCYKVTVKNDQTSGISAEAFLAKNGTIFQQGTASTSTGQQFSFGSGDSSLRFFATAGSGTGLKPGTTGTFNFCIIPKNQNTPWTLEGITYDKNGNLFTDTVINNVAGCVPPVICDSITHSQALNECTDTLTFFSRGTNSGGINKIVIEPQNGLTVLNASGPLWTASYSSGNATLTTPGPGIPESSSQGGFVVSYQAPSTTTGNYPVKITTYDVNGNRTCVNYDTILNCALSGVAGTSIPTPTLSIVPNPASGMASIMLTTGDYARVNLVLLDVLGRSIRSIYDGTMAAGDHTFTLDASTLTAGTYYLRMEANGNVITKKVAIER